MSRVIHILAVTAIFVALPWIAAGFFSWWYVGVVAVMAAIVPPGGRSAYRLY